VLSTNIVQSDKSGNAAHSKTLAPSGHCWRWLISGLNFQIIIIIIIINNSYYCYNINKTAPEDPFFKNIEVN
jgi:hypothetical protein